MKIWQASVVAAAIALVSTNEIASHGPDFLTPNAIVVEAFRTIPGDALALLTKAAAAFPVAALEPRLVHLSSNAFVATEFADMPFDAREDPCLAPRKPMVIASAGSDPVYDNDDCRLGGNDAANNPARIAGGLARCSDRNPQ